MAKLYKISAPVGSVMVPKQEMTEEDVRIFFPQIVQDPSTAEIWAEKAQKDPINELVELLERSGYTVEVIEKK